MYGQGRPVSAVALRVARTPQKTRKLTRPRPWWIVLCAFMLLRPSMAHGEDLVDLRLRIAWGGATARQWEGRLHVDRGEISNLSHLGISADQAATIYLDGENVQIRQGSSRQYDGFDFTLKAPATAELLLELRPLDRPQEASLVKVAVAELISGYHHQQLDEQNNRLLIQRVGGDSLRVEFDRTSLVFSPGESFTFKVQPHLLGLEKAESLRCLIQLVRARTDDVLQDDHLDFESVPGVAPSALGPFVLKLPEEEGVYDVIVSLHRRRFRDTYVSGSSVKQRKVQLVVIASEPSQPEVHPWQEIDSIDPNHVHWTEWLGHIPKLPLLPDFRQQPLSNNKSKLLKHLNREMIQLKPGGWQAYPLSIDRPGKPHILEIEYPSDLSQTLGVSVIEPDASGRVVAAGLDSSVDVAERWDISQPRMLRHRLVFWPRTKSPLILLTNRRPNDPAIFGTIRVLAGPDVLPAVDAKHTQLLAINATPPTPDATDNAPKQQSVPDGERPNRRLLAVYFDRPVFPKNFSASGAPDAWSGRSLDDWTTFYEGGKRLIEYLKYVGYNGAVISVACQGSTLYPSQLLEPNPKYDTGILFDTGQDPVRKDVLEMLFRLFDREGLTLIPAVQFSSPLKQLEQLRRSQPDETEGISLVNAQARTWPEVFGTRNGEAPYYNPLDSRVQSAMHAVLNELTSRCTQHASFGGLALQMEPSTYAQLPGELWGSDPHTIKRFENELGATTTGASGHVSAGSLAQKHRKAWLAWRAAQMLRFHQAIRDDLVKQRQGAHLFLMTGNMFSAPSLQHSLLPSLPNRLRLSDTMARIGLDAKRYDKQPGIVLFRPSPVFPTFGSAARAAEINLSTNPAAEHHFGQVHPAASLFFHEPLPRALPSFDAASPFGSDRTHVVLMGPVTPSAEMNRRRFVHALAERDTQWIIDGGWMLPMGQEDALRPLLVTLGQLPNEPFETAEPRTTKLLTQPLIVRSLHKEGKTYIYVLNDSPWAVSAEIDLRTNAPCTLRVLSDRHPPVPAWTGSQMTWSVDLEPYDVVAAVASSDEVQVDTWRATVDRQAHTRLRQQVNTLRMQAGMLHHPRQLEGPRNAGFEEAPDQLPGWIRAHGDGITIETDPDNPFRGKTSLKMHSDGPVAWIRSDPIMLPRTGRISIIVRLRTSDPKHQPPLRLAIEGRLGGKTYYRYAAVGGKTKPLDRKWGQQPFLLHINDLPVDGLTDLRVGFDLMGKGTVWIDDVQIYDLWFLTNERDELMIVSALATMALNQGQIGDCLRVLNGFWPTFLNEYVAAEQLRMAQRLPETLGQHRAFPPPQQQPSSVLDKVKKRLPKRLFPFQLR